MSAANFQFDTALIDPIINTMNSGLNMLMIGVLVLASLFSVIDLSFTAFFNWSENIGNTFTETLKKLIRYGITFGLIKTYTALLDMAYKLFSDIGNLFGAGLGSPLRIQSVWDELWKEISKFLEVGMKFKDFWALLYFVLFIIGFVFLVFIISTMTMVIIQFHIVGRLAIIFLACMPLDVLSDIGRKTLGAIVGAGTQLMVAVALCSMGTAILKTVPIPENIGVDNNEPQTILAWLTVFIAMSFLILNYQQISSLILFGQGGITGSQFGNFTGNVVNAGGSALGGVASVLGGAAVGGLGAAVGGVAGGIFAGKDGAMKGMKIGGSIGSRIGKAPGEAVTKTAENAGEAIKVMTMNADPVSVFKKIRNASIEEKENRKKEQAKLAKAIVSDSVDTDGVTETAEATKKTADKVKKATETVKDSAKENKGKTEARSDGVENIATSSNKAADTTEATSKFSDDKKVMKNVENNTKTVVNKVVNETASNLREIKEKREKDRETFVETEIRRERNKETFAEAESKKEKEKKNKG